MFLDRISPRIQVTVFVSFGVHLVLFSMFGSKKFSEAPKRLKLTEVEFQEEIEKPTQMQKLMSKIAAPPKPPVKEEVFSIDEALEELEKSSFQKVVGIKERSPKEDVSEMDLTSLAALPKFDLAGQPPAPAIKRIQPKHIALVRSRPSAIQALESKVVPLDELPPADFGPAISKRNFQQPEMIIKQVKAERRRKTKIDRGKQLSMGRRTYITGAAAKRQIIHEEQPRVPRWLEEKGIEAKVVIRFVVNPDGEVGDKIFVEKTSGYAELDRLAINALKKYIFVPLPLTAKQAEQSGTIVIRFTLR
ncbi:energy transducer TonB [bacterium]|nr:energy transducer TonB [bacterium]